MTHRSRMSMTAWALGAGVLLAACSGGQSGSATPSSHPQSSVATTPAASPSAVVPAGPPITQAASPTPTPAPAPMPMPVMTVPRTQPPNGRINPGDRDGDNRGGVDDRDGRV